MFILTVTLSGQLTTQVATKRKKETNLHYRNRKRKRPFPTNLPCLLKKNLHFGIHCFRLSQNVYIDERMIVFKTFPQTIHDK